MRRAGLGAWSIIGILICAYAAIWTLQKVTVIFPPLVLALLIIYLLNPIVGWLEHRGIHRTAGAIGTYVVVLGSLSLLVIALIPIVSEQVTGFANDWPRFRSEIAGFVHDSANGVEDRFGISIDTTSVDCLLDNTAVESQATCDSVTRELREQLSSQAGRLTTIGTSVLGALLVFILAPLIALYLLIDLPHLNRDLRSLVPQTHRDEMIDLGDKVSRAVGGFFRGQLLVAFIVGTLSSLGFYLIDLPFWLVIGAIAGFFNLVPLIGPFIGGGLGFLVGTISGGLGLGLKAALVELVVQQLDNHVISPNVMKRTVNLHPVTVMLSLLAGGTLAGFWGVLLGVPAVAVGKILLGHVWATRVLGIDASGSRPTPGAEAPSVVPEQGSEPGARAAEIGEVDDPPDTPEERAEPYPVPDRSA
ncbi:MAG TPA: AI-2E family transporter [Actinomycetota bacterium]|nr:AI-2E family transporter [Actinomycetota bacterium]